MLLTRMKPLALSFIPSIVLHLSHNTPSNLISRLHNRYHLYEPTMIYYQKALGKIQSLSVKKYVNPRY